MTGIPLVLILIYQCCNTASLNQQVNDYKIQEEQSLYLKVWVLKEDINAGEKITRSNLEKKKNWVLESDYIKKIPKLKQITGKRVKKSLKKGTIVREDLFSK